MAVVYTSIQTAGGWQTNTVKPAWDLLFHLALNAQPVCRQFVDVRPAQPTHTGNSITLQIKNNFSEAAVTAAKTPLTEESDVDTTQLPSTTTVTLTPAEYGFGTLRTLKIVNRSMTPVDPEIARAVGDHCGKVTDELLQDEMITGTQVYRGGGQTATNLITAADTLTSVMIRKGVTKLRANQVVPRDATNYVGLIHPDVSYDLRSEAGSGGWRYPMEYQTNERLFVGEIGQWEGARFIENARLRTGLDGATGLKVYRGFLLGREALAEAVVVEPHLVIGPIVDRLERHRPVGWYGDFDFGLFRNEAIVRFETASAAA